MKKKRVPRKIKKAAKKVSWSFELNRTYTRYEICAAVTGRIIKHTQRVLSNLKIIAKLYEKGINGEKIHLTKFNQALCYCKCYSLENDKEKWEDYLEKRRRL